MLFRASSMQVLGSLLSGQLGAAARIVALRRSSRAVCPQVPTLIAAEVPIVSVEVALAALTSFTLVGPLGLPWWSPLLAGALIVAGGAGLRRLALCTGRELWRGLAVIRSAGGGGRLVGWVLVAVFCQIFRNWLLLHAVGVDASFFDAIAVLIAVVTLGQLPVGPGGRRRRGRADPRPRRRRGVRRGRRADDRDRNRRRTGVRELGRPRPAVGGPAFAGPPDRGRARMSGSAELERQVAAAAERYREIVTSPDVAGIPSTAGTPPPRLSGVRFSCSRSCSGARPTPASTSSGWAS